MGCIDSSRADSQDPLVCLPHHPSSGCRTPSHGDSQWRAFESEQLECYPVQDVLQGHPLQRTKEHHGEVVVPPHLAATGTTGHTSINLLLFAQLDVDQKFFHKKRKLFISFSKGYKPTTKEVKKVRIKRKDRSKAKFSLQDIFANAYSFATHLPSPILLNRREPRVPFCFSSH